MRSAILLLALLLFPTTALAHRTEGYVDQVSLITLASGTQGKLQVRIASNVEGTRDLDVCVTHAPNPEMSRTNAYVAADEDRHGIAQMQAVLMQAKIAKRKVRLDAMWHVSGAYCELRAVEIGDFTPPDTIDVPEWWELGFEATNYIEKIEVSPDGVRLNLRRYACDGRGHSIIIPSADTTYYFSMALMATMSARKVNVHTMLNQSNACVIDSMQLM